MKALIAVLAALLATFVLTTAALESKDHKEYKRMLYWKRGDIDDLDDEELESYPRIIPYLKHRNRYDRPSLLQKRMVYW